MFDVKSVILSADVEVRLLDEDTVFKFASAAKEKGNQSPGSAQWSDLPVLVTSYAQLRLFKMKDFEAASELYSSGIAKFAERNIQRGDEVLLTLGDAFGFAAPVCLDRFGHIGSKLRFSEFSQGGDF